MISISLCMIVKNEEDVLERCLESVKLIADEIIIVDTGSTDKTKEIACKFTNKLYNFEWIDDFAAARNYSFSKSTKEFVMWLDADDIILSDDIKKFIELKKSLDSDIDTVMMKYNVQFDEDDNPICSYYRARLLKRKNNPLWSGPVHEVVTPYGNILYSEIAICHKKLHPGSIDRNVKIYDKFIKDGNKLSPRQEFYYARELSYNKRYKESIGMFNKFLNSKDGWVEDNIRACIDLANLYESIGSKDKILSTLFRSFEFDEPRAEVCCSIGNYFLDAGLYNLAIYWYEVALSRSSKDKEYGFINYECYGYLPAIQLCVCYFKLGNREKSIYYNDLASKFKPNDTFVKYNKNYFSQNI